MHVIRQNAAFGIEMTSPVPGSVIATATTTVGGRLIGAVPPVTVSVNGVAAVVTGSTFATATPLVLAEGENALLVRPATGSAARRQPCSE